MCPDRDDAAYRAWEKGFSEGFDTVVEAMDLALSACTLPPTGQTKAQVAYYSRVMRILQDEKEKEFYQSLGDQRREAVR